jgi:hypothetical protein
MNRANQQQQQQMNNNFNPNVYTPPNNPNFNNPGYGYQNMGNFNNRMVPNPYLQGHNPAQSPYGYQPPMQQHYPYNFYQPHSWNVPMMSQMNNPYINQNDGNNIPTSSKNINNMKTSFGGGWSKRAK